MVAWLTVFLCAVTSCAAIMDVDVVVLRAVKGRDARLPCGVGKVFLDGPESYVLWLKDERDIIHRYPNQETGQRPVDRADGSCDRGLCYDATSLLLRRVGADDAGIYRCRIHYQASQSVEYTIEVKLVESPGMPKIYSKDEKVNNGRLGPVSLGSNYTLTCEVSNGTFNQADTIVFWRRNGAVVEGPQYSRDGVLRAELCVRNATRAELDAVYECLVSNADVTEPLNASVHVQMFLPPISVEIRMNDNRDFEAGQPRVVDCVVVGCAPPPTITWRLGDTTLRSNVHKELHDGNYTVSSLTLAPSVRDNGHELSCSAHNPHIPDEDFEDAVTVTVGFRPFCLVQREETIGAVKGEAETATCLVESSPEPKQIAWVFPDSRTVYTTTQKITGHPNRYSSTLTWVPRETDYGSLTCRATNSFGEQKAPCFYTVAPGGPPSPPDCFVIRSYPSNIRIQCKKGWDGGRPQTVHLTLFGADGGVLYNVSDVAGHFQLPELAGRGNISAVVYASSMRGRSRNRTLHLQNVTPLSASTVATKESSGSWLHYVEVLGGMAGLALVAIAINYCIRGRRPQGRNCEIDPDGSFHREPDFTREARGSLNTSYVIGSNKTLETFGSSTGASVEYDLQSTVFASELKPPCRTHSACATVCPNNTRTYYV